MTLGIRFGTYKFCVDVNIQTIAVSLGHAGLWERASGRVKKEVYVSCVLHVSYMSYTCLTHVRVEFAVMGSCFCLFCFSIQTSSCNFSLLSGCCLPQCMQGLCPLPQYSHAGRGKEIFPLPSLSPFLSWLNFLSSPVMVNRTFWLVQNSRGCA